MPAPALRLGVEGCQRSDECADRESGRRPGKARRTSVDQLVQVVWWRRPQVVVGGSDRVWRVRDSTWRRVPDRAGALRGEVAFCTIEVGSAVRLSPYERSYPHSNVSPVSVVSEYSAAFVPRLCTGQDLGSTGSPQAWPSPPVIPRSAMTHAQGHSVNGGTAPFRANVVHTNSQASTGVYPQRWTTRRAITHRCG